MEITQGSKDLTWSLINSQTLTAVTGSILTIPVDTTAEKVVVHVSKGRTRYKADGDSPTQQSGIVTSPDCSFVISRETHAINELFNIKVIPEDTQAELYVRTYKTL